MRHSPPYSSPSFYSGAEITHTGLSDQKKTIDCLSAPAERLDVLLREVTHNRFNADAVPHGESTSRDILYWALGMICESDQGRAMALSARQYGWSIGMEDDDYDGHDLNFNEKKLTIPRGRVEVKSAGCSAECRHRILINLVRGLRDIWHDSQGHTVLYDLTPEDLIKQERIFAADLDSMAVCIAWDLRAAGHNDVWRYMLGSPLSDMADCFQNILKGEDRHKLALASAYAFHQWYRDQDRVQVIDHDTLDAIDYRLSTASVQNPFGAARLKPADIERMMRLPSGERYLQGLADAILQNPDYINLSDFNAAHLFQIIRDLEFPRVDAVTFRDPDLARRFFPEHSPKKV